MNWSDLKRSRLFQAFLIYVFIFFLIAYAVHIAEAGAGNQNFSSIFRTLWWAIVTATTVGYGDAVPVTATGKALSSLLMVVSLLFMSAVTATVASKFVEEKILEERGLKKFKDSGHIIICGWNEFGLTLLKSIIRESLGEKPVFYLINELNQEDIDAIRYEVQGTVVKFIKGNFVSEGVIHRANPSKASRIIILADTTHDGSYNKADERTILASLNFKGIAPDVPIVAELLSPENEIFLRRAKIDEIIIRGELDNSLLGIASISPGAAKLIKDILNPDTLNFIWELTPPHHLIGKRISDVKKWLEDEKKGILIGIVRVQDTLKLEEIFGDSSSVIDEFIREQFEEAEIFFGGKRSYDVELNPPDERILNEKERLVVINSRKPVEEEVSV